MQSKRMPSYISFFLYIAGVFLLAAGLALNTKAELGVAPVLTIPFCIASIWGGSFSLLTFLTYFIFVLLQFVLKRGKASLVDLLQFPFSFILSHLLGFFCKVFSIPCDMLWQKLLLLAAGIILTGAGVALITYTNFIPNPPDGLAQTLGQVLRKNTGFGKNAVDIGCVLLACIICLAERRDLVGIGLGTIISMLSVGRAVCLFTRLLQRLPAPSVRSGNL